MVTVVFYNLLRSKYRIHELEVKAGTIHEIIENIIKKVPAMKKEDFDNAVVFYNDKPLHFPQFSTLIEDNKRIVITHFVGGG